MKLVAAVLLVCFIYEVTSFCDDDSSCGANGCCVSRLGGYVKVCRIYLDEGDMCSLAERIGCGCRAGMTCKKSGFFRRCVVNDVGSGDY